MRDFATVNFNFPLTTMPSRKKRLPNKAPKSDWRHLIHPKHQAFEVFPFLVVQIYRMVCSLAQVVKYPAIAAGLKAGGHDGIVEQLPLHYPAATEGK